MQALVVAAADHQTAGELVHDDDLTILDHVIDVPLHHAVSPVSYTHLYNIYA